MQVGSFFNFIQKHVFSHELENFLLNFFAIRKLRDLKRISFLSNNFFFFELLACNYVELEHLMQIQHVRLATNMVYSVVVGLLYS